tara:strand:+ start:2117 stop:2695 length:579 start_codon:yes stop_codon:yes gene_type:complete
MAVADALTLVLEADPTNFEQGMGKAEQAADDFKEKQEEVALQNLETMASLEAITSGLNGLVGGYSKGINAMRDMNYVSEEQYQSLLQLQKQMELVIGPIEMIISAVKIMNAVMLMNPIMLIVVAIIALVAVLIILEMKFGVITSSIQLANEAMKDFKEWIFGIGDGLDGLAAKFEIIGDIGDKLTGYVGSIT